MDIPLELSFHNMKSSDGLQAAVSDHVARLEKLHGHIVGCRVVIEMPHKSHRVGQNLPDVHILLRVPGKEIAVTREMVHASDWKSATDAYAVLDNAFAVAASRLKDHRRILQGEVKYKSGEPRGAPERNQAFSGRST
jgi:ribosome-associated translation inhibitor RaiA